MREKWILHTKKADFEMLAQKLDVSPLIVRCMVNRGLQTEDEMRSFLYGSYDQLHDPMKMQDLGKGVELLKQAAAAGEKAAIASDFDCDGIFSGYLLWKAFETIGLSAEIFTPDRVQEGYGLNERIVDEALAQGCRVLVTCDNGIAAIKEVAYAKAHGMTVIVTDHHEIQECMPKADAVIDPKRQDETYPFDGLCGAGVAFKLICALYDACGINSGAKSELLEHVAIATVADVMELRGENRILVREGLKRLNNTRHVGLRALLEVQGLWGKNISAGNIGFILAPCFNSAGRIATVKESFDLLLEQNSGDAREKAVRLKEINESRKDMTERGTKKAIEIVEQRRKEQKMPGVLLVLVPDVHESLVGIIAGRVREKYNHPVIVFTRTQDGRIKGSGRSIEQYHMFRELLKCKDLMDRFGGHKMAAGMTLREENFAELDRRLNADCTLTEEDFQPVVMIDAPMPVGYVTEKLLDEFSLLEPFGVGNSRPVFAEQHFKVLRGYILGKEKNVLKLRVQNQSGSQCDAMLFHGRDDFEEFVRQEWGEGELNRMYEGKENYLDIAFSYFPMVNEYMGKRTIQIQIIGYCRVNR